MLLFNEGVKTNQSQCCCFHDCWEIHSGIIETPEINGLLGFYWEIPGLNNFPSDLLVIAIPVFSVNFGIFPGKKSLY